MKKKVTVLLMFLVASFSLMALPYKADDLPELPLVMDFELFYGTNLADAYPGWMEATGYQQPEYSSGSWYRADVIHGSATAGISYTTIGLIDSWILSPQFEATVDTKVSFMAGLSLWWDEPQQGHFAHNDSVTVMVATEGLTFNHVVHTFKMGNAPDWRLEHFDLDLSQFAGQVITLGIYATNGQEANSNGCFHLDDIVIKDAVPYDAMALGLIEPTPSTCLSGEFPVVVEIKNDGNEPISAVPVRVRVRGVENMNLFGAYEGVIEPGEIVQFEVGTIAGLPYGDYTFNVITELPGDGYAENNSLADIQRSNPEPKVLPLPKMDFVGLYTDINALYPDWYEARGKGQPAVAKDTDWQGESYGGARTANVYFTNIGTEDWIIGPKILATEYLTVDLRAAVQYEDGTSQMGSDDYLGIMVSTDCGATFERAGKIDQQSTVNTVLQPFTFPLSQYAGQEIIVALYATTGAINNSEKYLFHVTDLHIKNQYQKDASITRLLAPGNSCAFSDTEQIVVEIKNFGKQELTNLDVAFEFIGAEAVVETITETIPGDSTLVYTFNSTIDLSASADNTISVYTMLEGDDFEDNDGLYDLPLQLSSFDLATEGAYEMGFEEDEDFSAWAIDDGNGDEVTWFLDNQPNEANSGSYSFSYFSNQTTVASNDWFISPCFNLEAGKTYSLSFFYKNRAGIAPESLKVNLGTEQNGGSMDQLIIDLGEINNSTHMKAEATFSVETSGEYYLGWHAYGPADQFGLHIDDVTIYQVFDFDLSATNYIVPKEKDENCGLLPAESVEVEVTNLGSEDVTEFDVNIVLDGGSPFVSSFTQTIAAGESAWVALESGFTIEPDQIYNIEIMTQHAQDINPANDGISVENYLMSQFATSFEATDDLSGWAIQDDLGGNVWELMNKPSVSRTGDFVYGIRTDGANGNTGTDDWLFTECLELKAGTCYEFTFYYRAHFSIEFITFWLGTEQSSEGMTENLGSIQGFENNDYIKETVQFTVPEDGVYYLAWNSYRPVTNSGYFIYIDDVSVTEDLENQPEANPSYEVLDLEVAFSANAENVSSYLWDFGDGNSSEEMNPFHIYEQPGTYQASLTAGSGCTDVFVEFEVVVELNPYNIVFNVEDQAGQAITDAVVTIDGESFTEGQYQFERIQGAYTYSVEREGFETVNGFFTVIDQDLNLDVVLGGELEVYSVTFIIKDSQNNDIPDATIIFHGESYDPGVYVVENLNPGTYNYRVVYENYAEVYGQVEVVDQDITEVVILQSTGISNPQAGDIKVYPNPATDKLFVNFNGTITSVRIVNLTGQVLIEQQVASGDNTEVNVAGLKAGSYILQVISDGKVYPSVFLKK